ncbi:MAG: HD domain-containing protein [Anaerostipes sp.]|jgi:(p)ppGpp synthase/HD superfamily hydrolase|nr:HD domain-containing protein [Anaerostipes sp.]MDD3745066.1 HD domain-containing protein [Anaerostipes sp.]
MFEDAIIFATEAHQGQKRKGTQIPFIIHPLEVASIVGAMTTDEDLLCAAVLHDVVEDCEDVSLSDIRETFGDNIANYVDLESEDKEKTWIERKGRTIDFLLHEAKPATKMIALADKLANIRSLSRDYKELGDKLWERFNMKDKTKQSWYYRGMIDAFYELNQFKEYDEYCKLVDEVFPAQPENI